MIGRNVIRSFEAEKKKCFGGNAIGNYFFEWWYSHCFSRWSLDCGLETGRDNVLLKEGQKITGQGDDNSKYQVISVFWGNSCWDPGDIL